jgi:ferredoxin-NADP reductase
MKRQMAWDLARVASFRDLTPTVREFSLFPSHESIETSGSPTWACGAHLQVQVNIKGQLQIRHYSLVGLPDGRFWTIAVKRMDSGQGGSKAMWDLWLGEHLSVSSPQNHFPLSLKTAVSSSGAAPDILLVAGGIGITPLVGMAEQLAASARPFRMLYAARNRAELAYVTRLQEVLGEGLDVFVENEGQRIDIAAEIAKLPVNAQLYTCGPAPLLGAIRAEWQRTGRAASDLRFESFGSGGSLGAQAFRVLIPRHHIDMMVAGERSLLSALEEAGIPALSNCRRGECGLCVMDVLEVEGELDHRDVFLSEAQKREAKQICVCVSRVVGSVTLDTAYRA